jgi:hypothetical protein
MLGRGSKNFDGAGGEAPKGIASFRAHDGRKILPRKAVDLLQPIAPILETVAARAEDLELGMSRRSIRVSSVSICGFLLRA